MAQRSQFQARLHNDTLRSGNAKWLFLANLKNCIIHRDKRDMVQDTK